MIITFNSFEDETLTDRFVDCASYMSTFNSFEDETNRIAVYLSKITGFQFLWGWNTGKGGTDEMVFNINFQFLWGWNRVRKMAIPEQCQNFQFLWGWYIIRCIETSSLVKFFQFLWGWNLKAQVFKGPDGWGGVAFNSFEDETKVGVRYLDLRVFLSIPLRMKHKIRWTDGDIAFFGFQFLWGWNSTPTSWLPLLYISTFNSFEDETQEWGLQWCDIDIVSFNSFEDETWWNGIRSLS